MADGSTTETQEALTEHDRLPALKRNFKIVIEPRAKKKGKKATGDSAEDERASSQETGQGDDDENDEGAGDGMEGAYDVSLSSEQPVDRWFGREVLLHDAANIDLSRADPESGLPLLAGHDDRSLPIGRLKNLRAEDGKLKASLVPSKTPRGQEAKILIDEGHREMSLGYEINEYECTPGKAGEADEYRATRWTPMEGSLVSVPADATVGVGRSKAGKLFPVHVKNARSARTTEDRSMADAIAGAAASAANGKAAAEIVRRAVLHGLTTDEGLSMVERGLTIEQVNAEILEKRGTKATKQPASEQLALSEGEAQQYSYSRAILSAAQMVERGGKGEACFELDVSQELERTLPDTYRRKGGLLIPMSLRGQKWQNEKIGNAVRKSIGEAQMRMVEGFLARAAAGTIDSQTVNQIKEVVFTEYGGELIQILRNQAKVVQMGARVLTGLSSPIAWPRQTTDVTAYWVSENSGTDVTASNVGTDLVVLSPRSLQASTAYSRQLLVQSSVDVEALVRTSIAAKHALAWDLAAIHGTGSNNQPLGIYNQPNVLTVDFSNAAYSNTGNKIAYTGATQMENLIAQNNALELGELGYMTTPGIGSDAKNTLKFPAAAIAQGGVLWDGTLLDGEMNGYKAVVTNQVSKTLGANGAPSGGTFQGLIFGAWSELIIGQFGGAMEMIVDPYSKKKQGLIEVASFQMSDVAVRHPVAFCIGTNLNA